MRQRSEIPGRRRLSVTVETPKGGARVMRWPWQRTEHRASATDALVAAIQSAAQGNTTGDWRAIAALESAVSLYCLLRSRWQRSFVRTRESQRRSMPPFLAMVARALIRRGEFCGGVGRHASARAGDPACGQLGCSRWTG